MAKWIKVTDKLPKIGQSVLAASKDDMVISHVISVTETLQGKSAEWAVYEDSAITHWQPLPALPEVEGGGEC